MGTAGTRAVQRIKRGVISNYGNNSGVPSAPSPVVGVLVNTELEASSFSSMLSLVQSGLAQSGVPGGVTVNMSEVDVPEGNALAGQGGDGVTLESVQQLSLSIAESSSS